MSQQNPEEIRAEIEATRARLGSDVDAVAEKVTPGRVVDRQKSKVQDTVRGVRERVMGSSDDDSGGGPGRGEQARQQVSEKKEDVANRVQEGTEQARRQMRGNPLAAGLVARGAAGEHDGSCRRERQCPRDLA